MSGPQAVAGDAAPPVGQGARAPGVRRLLTSHVTAIVVWAIGLRVVTAGIAFLANVMFPLDRPEQFTVLRQTNHFWDAFARYDSGWYYGIARDGYRFAEGGRSNLAFFPLYPLLMRAVARLFGNRAYHFYIAGIVISWAAFVVAMVLLYRVARLDLSRRAANRAVLYASIFPFAFFYGVVYSESLFLMLMLAAVYGFRTRRWLIGGVGGALASATRVNGVMMLPALAWIGWEQTRGDRRQRWYATAAVGLAAAGLAVYSVYVYSLTGSFIEWYHSITRWQYVPGTHGGGVFIGFLRALIVRPYAYLTQEPAAPYDLLNGGAGLMFLLAIPLVWRRLGGAYGLLMLMNLALPVSAGQFEGLGRYCAVLFPAFIWLATFRRSSVQTSITVVFAMMYVLCLALFVNIHPIF
jgi:hypothetical protein